MAAEPAAEPQLLAPPGEAASPSGQGDAAALDANAGCWELHLGPLTWRGGDGNSSGIMELRPQMKFGGKWGLVRAAAGISDVRDGLKFDFNCKAFTEIQGTGHSLDQLHENVRLKLCNGVAEATSRTGMRSLAEALGWSSASCAGSCLPGASEALEKARSTLSSSGSEIWRIASSLGLKAADLDHMLNGPSDGKDELLHSSDPGADGREPMKLCIRGSSGLGVSAQMCLGWCDTKGYRMVGVGGKADAGVAAGGSVFAGRHVSGVGLKIVLGVSNFTLFYDFPNAAPPPDEATAPEDEDVCNREQET